MTTTGPLSTDPYFIRLSKTGDPNAATTYNLGNGGPDADQRAVIDAGLPRATAARHPAQPTTPTSPAPSASSTTSSRRPRRAAPGFYRYGVDTPGTEDGYGDCNIGDSTDCTVQGKPWAGICADPGPEQGLRAPLAGAVRRARRAAHRDRRPRRRRSSCWREMAAHRVRRRTDPRTGLGEPRPGRRRRTAPQPECASIGFTERQGGRQRLAADLVGGAVRPALGRPPGGRGDRATGRHDGALHQQHAAGDPRHADRAGQRQSA